MIINIRRGRGTSEGIATSSRPVRWMRGAGGGAEGETRPCWESAAYHAALEKPSPGNYHVVPLKSK